MAESQADEINRWVGRVAMSRMDRKRDKEVRLKLLRWYRNQFWENQGEAMDEEKPELRQVNYTSMLARTLMAQLYAQAPTMSVCSPWNTGPANSVLSATCNNLPRHVGFRKVAHQCILDAVVGRFGVAQVGFNADFGWDSASMERDQRWAQQENMNFGKVSVKRSKGEDDQLHIKEHAAYKQILVQQAMQSGMEPPYDTLSYIDAHMNEHAEAAKGMRGSPHEYARDRRVWVSRVMPVRDQKVAFGWEYKTRFEDARWIWRTWVKPLSELKADKNINSAGLTATEDLVALDDTKELEGGLTREAAAAFSPDRQMVRGVEVIDRAKQKRMIYALGHDRWLYNEKFEFADLFRASGYHLFSLLMDPEMGSGKSVVEDAASAIITICNGEGMLYRMMHQTAPGMIANAAAIEGRETDKIQKREIGEITPVNFIGGTDDIRKVLMEFAGARIPQENLASLFRAESNIGRDFGTGQTALGGNEVTNTATAAFANADASGSVIGGLWGTGHECWMRDIFADALQCVKEYYDDDSLRRVVGIDRMQEWAQLRQTFTKDVEVVEVDAGSSLAGRVDKQREDALTLFTTAGQHQLSRQRELLEDVYTAFGKDPNRYVITRQEEAAMAAQQPGPSPDLVGEKNSVEQQGRPSEAQGGNVESQMRSQASERSAEAAQRQ